MCEASKIRRSELKSVQPCMFQEKGASGLPASEMSFIAWFSDYNGTFLKTKWTSVSSLLFREFDYFGEVLTLKYAFET